MTDEERGPEQELETNHWQSLAGELGVDYDASRAEPRQIELAEERSVVTPAAETPQPSQPTSFAWFGQGIGEDIDMLNSAHAAETAEQAVEEKPEQAPERPAPAKVSEAIDAPTSTVGSERFSAPAADDPIPMHAWDLDEPAASEEAPIGKMPIRAALVDESPAGIDAPTGTEPVAHESLFEVAEIEESVFEEMDEPVAQSHVDKPFRPSAWEIDEETQPPSPHVEMPTDSASNRPETQAAKPVAKAQPTAQPAHVQEPPVAETKEEPPVAETKHVSHWNKLAGFLGLGSAKSAPRVKPVAAEQAKPETAESIFETFSNDPDVVKSRASQHFVDSMFGTDSSKPRDPEPADLSDPLDDTEDEFANSVDDDELDSDEPTDEDDAELHPHRGRRRRGSRGRGRGRSRDRSESDETPTSVYDEQDSGDFDEDDANSAEFGDAKEDVATGAYGSSYDAPERSGQARSRNIPSWIDCIGVIVTANMENHKKGGGEARPQRRRRRNGNNRN